MNLQHVVPVTVKVSERHALTPLISRFRLESADGSPLPAFTAGSHIEVQITPELNRAYSLCSDPAQRGYYDIAVRREDEGRGGSKALHALALPGAEFQVSAPNNCFPLEQRAAHHLLIGGGVGLTPLMAMAHELAAKGEDFSIIACASDETSLPFAAELAASGWDVTTLFGVRSCMDLSTVLSSLPGGTHVYCCGPNGFIDLVREQCSMLPAGCWHEESFAPLENLADKGYELYLSESDLTVPVAAGSSMLAALRQAGIHVDTTCEQGICGSCVVAWKDGDPEHHDQCLEDEEREEYVALCCGGCRSERLTLEL
ncbi:MAG: ferredoxin--NADP(+) reductase [Oleibacter sp.]|nr:ferredoxin--NADP(+) reductase [Thalassolituus sp.]|tara:strand:+ start:400 stop:1341 length:942 start_codon:yes stop_codon:yes gene_type:complete